MPSTARWARIGYSLVAWLFAIAAVIQIYLAGLGMFAPPNSFEQHRNVGYAIGILGLVLLVLSFAAKMPRRVIAATALLFVLMIGQALLVWVRTDQPNIAALHPVNGFVIVLLSFWIAWHTLRYLRAPLPIEPERAATAPVIASSAAPPETVENRDDETNP